MNNLVSLLLRSGPARIIAAIGATAIVAALIFGVVFNVGQEDKELLYSGLDMKEAGEMTAKLDASGIKYDLKGDGSTIYVQRSKVLSARMMLSADGLPTRGSVGYEIFDKPDALGQTQFMQNINRLRALEGELARSIATLDGVASARVHLVLPERQLFERDTQQPTASIVLKLTRNSLSSGEVKAIRNLVAGATPGLNPQQVTILDETGALLAAAQNPNDAGSEVAEGRQTEMQERLRRTVQDIVEGVVGQGNARVQVTADLDLSKVQQTSETFDPDGRVVRSTQTVSDNSTEKDSSGRGAASAGNNVPGGASGQAGASGTSSERTEETTNYEISKTTKTEIIESGAVKKLSVAVAVDGVLTPAKDGKGEAAYTPRSAEDLQRITTLVRSAVGFDEARGDKVEVVNLRFARPAIAGAEVTKPGMFSFQSTDIMRGAEIGAALVAALALIFFVLGPMAAGLAKPAQGMGLLEGGGGILPAGAQTMIAAQGVAQPAVQQQILVVPGASGQQMALPPMASGLPGPSGNDPEPLIDVARIRGQVRASSTKKIGEVVAQHPEESASIIRGWLNNAI